MRSDGVEAPSQIQKFMWVVPSEVETVLDVVRHTGMVEGGEVVCSKEEYYSSRVSGRLIDSAAHKHTANVKMLNIKPKLSEHRFVTPR
jgi:hypothetical protein